MINQFRISKLIPQIFQSISLHHGIRRIPIISHSRSPPIASKTISPSSSRDSSSQKKGREILTHASNVSSAHNTSCKLAIFAQFFFYVHSLYTRNFAKVIKTRATLADCYHTQGYARRELNEKSSFREDTPWPKPRIYVRVSTIAFRRNADGISSFRSR